MLVEATSVKTVADRVFNLLKGYGFQIDTYNKEGEVVGDPADAIRFFVEDFFLHHCYCNYRMAKQRLIQ